MNHDIQIILVFLSKIPVYAYTIYKAYKYRHSLLIVSSNWLGCLAFFGAISSISVAYLNRLVASVIAYGVVLSLFMLAYTAREVKKIKE